MKVTFLTLPLIAVVALASWTLANDPATGAGSDRRDSRGGHRASLERITNDLNLTPDQKAKIQPIIDQTQPQIESIRREAIQKMKAVMDNAKSQIRPLLTPEQQKKLDEVKDQRRMGREGHGGRHGRQGQDGQNDDSDVGDQ